MTTERIERVLVSELADDISIIDDPHSPDGIRAWARTRAETVCDLARQLDLNVSDLRYRGLLEVQARQTGSRAGATRDGEMTR